MFSVMYVYKLMAHVAVLLCSTFYFCQKLSNQTCRKKWSSFISKKKITSKTSSV